MAYKFIALSQKIGSLTKSYSLQHQPMSLIYRNTRITTSSCFSSISTDLLEMKQCNLKRKKKSKNKLTNIFHVGESVTDERAEVKRLKPSKILKINSTQFNSEFKDENSSINSGITTTTTTTYTTKAIIPTTDTHSSAVFNTEEQDKDTLDKNLHAGASTDDSSGIISIAEKENENLLDTNVLTGAFTDASSSELFINEGESVADDVEILDGNPPSGKVEASEVTTVKKKEKGKKKKSSKDEKLSQLFEELRHEGRNQNFNQSLAAYLSVCDNCGFTGRAYHTFMSYVRLEKRQTKNKRFARILNIVPYNAILKGIASQGDYKKMKSVREQLKKSSLTPTHDTFAQILTCLGKVESSADITKDIESTLQWMDEQKITLNEMFAKASSFQGDAMKYCVQVVERVIPDVRNQLEIFNHSEESLLKKHGYRNRLVMPLNDSLFSNKISSPAEGVLTRDELALLTEKQIEQELKGIVKIPTIRIEELSDNVLKNRTLLEKWKINWRKSLHRTVAAQKKFMFQNFAQRGHSIDFYPYFHCLDTEDIVNLLLLEVNNLCTFSEHYSSTLTHLSSNLGTEFFYRFHIKYKQKTNVLNSLRKVYNEYCTWYLQRTDNDASYVPRVQWAKLEADEIMNANVRDDPCEWPYPVRVSIGKQLYNIIFSCVVVWKPGQEEKDALPAFYKVQRTYGLKLRDELKPSPILVSVFQGAAQKYMTFPSGLLPMLSPPVPWTDTNHGGYFVSKSHFVRLLDHALQQKTMMKKAVENLYPVMDSLNELGAIPWKINTPMLDILIEVYNKKGWQELDIVPHASLLQTPPKINSGMTSKEKREIVRQRIQHKKKKNEASSIWCDILYKLSLANFYRNNVIWLPQNLDFRGRTYPIPPHLTHISSDVFRSALLFAQGKKLGKDGLYWLKLHVINLTGLKKKCSLQERLDFFDEVKDEIYDSARNPLTGRKWWMQSDDPWQTLAACKEVVAALESENSEDYVSHLPIHQDGSCNGLQHYAALGRDIKGAESVNLRPRETPQDVYSVVADLVEKRRKEDAENGDEIAQVLDGFVKRKVVKQPVMTTVYGVTRYGAKLQILKQLKYIDEFPEKYQTRAATYLCDKTFQSLGSIFATAKEIQDWFVRLAEAVSKGFMKNVDWVTPLGLPVVQPYSVLRSFHINPGKLKNNFNNNHFLVPNTMKQKNGFPPNFIHSLDSSHMMLTSLQCQLAGITFVSIHDCFWTHACSVPIMNKICREQFVKLHSEPILEDLANYLREKYSSHKNFSVPFTIIDREKGTLESLETLIQNVPRRGEFDITEVLDSVFFFS